MSEFNRKKIRTHTFNPLPPTLSHTHSHTYTNTHTKYKLSLNRLFHTQIHQQNNQSIVVRRDDHSGLCTGSLCALMPHMCPITFHIKVSVTNDNDYFRSASYHVSARWRLSTTDCLVIWTGNNNARLNAMSSFCTLIDNKHHHVTTATRVRCIWCIYCEQKKNMYFCDSGSQIISSVTQDHNVFFC